MKLLKILLINLTSLSLLLGQISVAVVEFEGKGISKHEASALTDRFRDELCNNSVGKYQVMERAYMEQILKEQGFQLTGCTSNECMIEVGQLIAVSQIIGGSISKIGNVYSVSARIISVETGKILKVATYDSACDIGTLMTVGMRKTVLKLISGKTIELPPKEIPSSEKNSSIYIKSQPSEAEIIIDGTKTGIKTPNIIEKLTPGEHRLTLQKGNFVADTTVILDPYEIKTIQIVLKKGAGRLIIKTIPYEATVYLNGIEIGLSPKTIKDIISGEHHIKVIKEGYFPYETIVSISANEVKTLEINLKKPATLIINSIPENAEFTLGNKYQGITPATLQIEEGRYKLKAYKDNYYPFETELVLKEGEFKEYFFSLKHTVGNLEIVSDQAPAEVLLNGNKIGVTPLKLKDLNSGIYKITLVKDYYILDTTINIIPDITNFYKFQLKLGQASLKVFTTPSKANIFIDDEELGLSPLQISNITAGPHNIMIKKVGFNDYVQSITLNHNEDKELYATLTPKSLLKITAQQDSVYLFIDNQEIGFAPVSIYLNPGMHELSYFKNGYVSGKQAIFIEESKINSFKVPLLIKHGSRSSPKYYAYTKINIFSNPSGAMVVFDDEILGTTPIFNYKTTPGNHQINVKKKGYQEYYGNILILNQKKQDLNLELIPAKITTNDDYSFESNNSSNSSSLEQEQPESEYILTQDEQDEMDNLEKELLKRATTKIKGFNRYNLWVYGGKSFWDELGSSKSSMFNIGPQVGIEVNFLKYLNMGVRASYVVDTYYNRWWDDWIKNYLITMGLYLKLFPISNIKYFPNLYPYIELGTKHFTNKRVWFDDRYDGRLYDREGSYTDYYWCISTKLGITHFIKNSIGIDFNLGIVYYNEYESYGNISLSLFKTFGLIEHE